MLDALGQGAMGSVYTAFDPDLDRRVALKVVSPREHEHPSDLSREARVLAKLDHPNVATIFDVGFWEEQLFIAMERVDGGDLDAWLKDDHSPTEILDLLLQAGHGLQAAHARGVVHRDFKPSNVLVGTDGRVRVADFGLARLGPDEGAAPAPGDSMRGVFDSQHAVAGTPIYMAPELSAGEPASARSDQYAFCVTAHWALARTMPCDGSTASLPLHPEARRAIARGLAPDPTQRFESMDALLATLSPPRRRRRVWFAGGIAVGVLSGAVAVASIAGPVESKDDCEAAARAFEDRYRADRRATLHDALASAPLPYASSAARRADAALTEFGREWTDAYHHACALPVPDAATRCLDAQAAQHDALWNALEQAGPAVAEHVVPAVASLPLPSACIADDAPPRPPLDPPDPADQDAADIVRDHLERAWALRSTNQYEQALDATLTAVEAARALAHPPLVAEALLARGRVQHLAGELEAAQLSLEEAATTAWSCGHDDAALSSIAMLLWDVGQDQGDRAAADVWLKVGQATVERRGWPTAAEAEFWNAAGGAEQHAGRWSVARTHFERALSQRERFLSKSDPLIVQTMTNLASLDLLEGDFERALERSEHAVEQLEAALGPQDPGVSQARQAYGRALLDAGQLERGRDVLQAALDSTRANLGEDHPLLASMSNNLGMAHDRLGDDTKALEYYAAALASWQAHRKPTDPKIGEAHYNVGWASSQLGHHDDAVEHMQSAIALMRTALGETHPQVSMLYRGHADVLRLAGRCEEATVQARRAVALFEQASERGGSRGALALFTLGQSQMCADDLPGAEQTLASAVEQAAEVFGASHPNVRTMRAQRADVLRKLGRIDDGLAEIDRALSIEGSGPALSTARLTQARLLRERDPAHALEVARQALADMPQTGGYAKKRDALAELIAALELRGSGAG